MESVPTDLTSLDHDARVAQRGIEQSNRNAIPALREHGVEVREASGIAYVPLLPLLELLDQLKKDREEQ